MDVGVDATAELCVAVTGTVIVVVVDGGELGAGAGVTEGLEEGAKGTGTGTETGTGARVGIRDRP